MHQLESMVTKGKNFGFRVTDELLAQLDLLRRAESDLPTRGEMLRRLVERAASAEAKPAKAKKKPASS